MSRNLIMGTAGHIDHGKTALVCALTGVDTDRLPEEKTRGITIDIGFARLDLGEFQVGVVDVPGHERFIKNMLAGASGIDFALLLVAADDSVMPQTREHLEILQLLGLRHGLIAISKCDLVSDPSWIDLVEDEVRELVAGTFLQGAPIIRTAAHRAEGIEELKAAIARICSQIEPPGETGFFRLAVDRSFAVAGHGTIVTGSVWSGEAHVGDEVGWLPSGKLLRVRGIQNHETSVSKISRGQRGAINLGGVHHREIVRGDEIATPGYLKPSRILTVRLNVLASSATPIKHRSRLRLHLGTAERIAAVSLLDANVLAPGQWGKAQLFVSEPVVAVYGQPFVVRRESPMVTVGGGQVLQPAAGPIGRRRSDAITRLEQLCSEDAATRAECALSFFGTQPWTEMDLVRDAGLQLNQAGDVIKELARRQSLLEFQLGRSRSVFLTRESVSDLEGRLLKVLGRFHDENPLQVSILRQKVVSAMDYMGDDALVQGLIDRLIAAKRIVGDQHGIARADFVPRLSAAERKLRQRIIDLHKEAGFQPPDVAQLEKLAGSSSKAVPQILELCCAEGHLVHMSGNVYLHTSWEETMKQQVAERLNQGPGLTVSEIRDMLGTTRKFALPFCEYLDRTGVTRREGDLRVLADRGVVT